MVTGGIPRSPRPQNALVITSINTPEMRHLIMMMMMMMTNDGLFNTMVMTL